MRHLGLALLVVTALACKSRRRPDLPGDCLKLPGTLRQGLVADPAGGGLYWIELVRSYDFHSDLYSFWRLVRFDLETRRLDNIASYVWGPIEFVQDSVVVRRASGDSNWLAMVHRDGHVQALTPAYLDVRDVELIDGDSLAILANGDGPTAVYTIDLDRPRPHHLIDAGVLLSATGGRVFAKSADEGVVVDLSNGQRQTFALPGDGIPHRDAFFWVSNSRVLARGMPAGEDRVVVAVRKPWKLVHLRDAVLARAVEQDRSYAYLLSQGAAKQLPTIVGGASILEVASLGDRHWALVGHNTANYEGDLADAESESDVCLLPARGEIKFPTRNVPARFADKQAAVFAAAAKHIPDGTIQVFDGYAAPTTLSINVSEQVGNDFDRMRTRTREFHRDVTSVFGEREMRTQVHFGDRRTAAHRWRRSRLRDRTVVGMGTEITDPSDFDLEIRNYDAKKYGDTITCSGTIMNLRSTPLRDVELRCVAGDRQQSIRVPELAPNATHDFAGTFASDGAGPLFEAFVGREPLEVHDVGLRERNHKIHDMAVAVFDETQLALDEISTDDGFELQLRAPRYFDSLPHFFQLITAERAFHSLATVRDLYEVDATVQPRLRIYVDRGGNTYVFDGADLTQE